MFYSTVCPQGAAGLFGLLLKTDSSHCALNPQEASVSYSQANGTAYSIAFVAPYHQAKASHKPLVITPLLRAPLPKERCFFFSWKHCFSLFSVLFPVCSLRASKADGCGKPPDRRRKPIQGTRFTEPAEGPAPMKMTVDTWASAWEPGSCKLAMLSSCSEAQAPAIRSHDSEHEKPRIFLSLLDPFQDPGPWDTSSSLYNE